jgi:O-antigen/teichoic acid export membrane protein
MAGGVEPGSGLAPAPPTAPGSGLRPIGTHLANLVSRDALNRLARFVVAVLLARSLTLEDYGLVNTGIAVAGIVVMATSLGLNELGARDIGARQLDAERRSDLFGVVATTRLGLVIATGVIAIVAVALISPPSLPPVLLVVAIALTMSSTAEWVLRGLERMKAFGNAMLAGGLIAMLGSAVVFVTTGTATAGLAVILLGEAATVWATWRWAGTAPRLRVDPHGVYRLVRRSWPLGVSSLATYSYSANVDTVLLAAMRSAEEAGLYSAPYRVFLGLNAVSILAGYAFLPTLARAFESDDHEIAFANLRRGVRYLLLYGAVLLLGAQLVGAELLGLLFGDEFEQQGDVFVVLSLSIMWFSVGFPIGYGLIAKDQNRRFLAGAATGGLLNLALNLALIPPFGTIGAAFATAGAFVAACLVWVVASRAPASEVSLDIGVMSLLSLLACAGLTYEGIRIPAILLTAVICVVYGRFVLGPWLRLPLRR